MAEELVGMLPAQMQQKFDQLKGTPEGQLFESRLLADRDTYTRVNEMLDEARNSSDKRLPNVPLFFRFLDPRNQSWLQNHNEKVHQSEINAYCSKRASNSADNDRCQTFMTRLQEIGTKLIASAHKGYKNTELSSEE